jgi:hypothetical protein
MSRKNEFARSTSRSQDSEDPRELRGGQGGNQESHPKPTDPLSDEDINEQIRAFFAQDEV